MSDLISREQTLKYAKAKVDALIIEFNMREQAHAGGFTVDAAKLLIKRIIQNAPDAEQPQIIRCKDCKWSDWYTAGDGKKYCYCMETGAAARTENDYCSYAEREETTPSRQDVEEKYWTWHRILQAYHDPANGLSYKVVDLQCPVCKEWLGSAEPVEECPNCGTKMETEEEE